VAMALKTVSAGMAYNAPGSGKVVILSVHQTINLQHLPHKLLYPMQMRLNAVVVSETPKFQCANPTNISYTITFKGEDLHDEMVIPLDLHGVVWSCFTTRKPTQEEFYTCDRFELTYASPGYDPSGSSYAEQEAVMMDSRGQLKVAEEENTLWRQLCLVHMAATFSDTTIKLQALSLTLEDSSLLQEMTAVRSILVSSYLCSLFVNYFISDLSLFCILAIYGICIGNSYSSSLVFFLDIIPKASAI
jgi:hypothetical protein